MEGALPASKRSGSRLGARADALRARQEIPECQPGMGLAVGVPPAASLARQNIRGAGPPPPRSKRGAKGC